MKIMHISDLHLGKRVNEISMLEEQRHILGQILDIAVNEQVNAIVAAGDIYDKQIPSEEAVQLFDDFLVKASALNIPLFAISGNHDSPERVSFGARLMIPSGIYLSQVYSGNQPPVTLTDEYGEVNIYMLPFVRPSAVRQYFEGETITSYDDAVRTAVKNMNVDTQKRNIIIAHQFVTGAVRCESETVMVGGLDNIGADIFDIFDYAALGHIHGAQHISRPETRYCGTPLKYSLSEAGQDKSVTIAELREKGNVNISTVKLSPIHDMRVIRGTYAEVTDPGFYTDNDRFDYVHIVLTDEQDIHDAVGRLRRIYPNIMKLDYDNLRTKASDILSAQAEEDNSPEEMFAEFYKKYNNAEMNDEQKKYISDAVAALWNE